MTFDRSPSTTECLRSLLTFLPSSIIVNRLLCMRNCMDSDTGRCSFSPPLSVTRALGMSVPVIMLGSANRRRSSVWLAVSGMSPLPHDLATETLRTRPVADEDLCILVLLFISAPVVLGAKETLARFRGGLLVVELSSCTLIGRCIVFRDSEDLRMPPLVIFPDSVEDMSTSRPVVVGESGHRELEVTSPRSPTPSSTTIVARETGRLRDGCTSGREN